MTAAPLAGDRLTVITTAGRDRGKLATKRITRDRGKWQIEDYSNATWWSVRQIDVHDLVSLGNALTGLEPDRWSCVIRGEPLPDVDLTCTRRLKDTAEDGTPPSFAPAARRWFGIDFDSLPTPIWNTEQPARRRAAIERDRRDHGPSLPKGEDDGEDVDLDGDEDPAPIDPARDWTIAIRAALTTLPNEFHDASAYWQMTSGAGIKPGIRLRLWYWCDRPVSDDEAKRWLEASPIDTSLYCANTPHYTAAPIFDPPELDPVPLRSGFWWGHWNAVSVPDLQEKPKLKPQTIRQRQFANLDDRAERYAHACIRAMVAAPEGQGRKKMLAVACVLYGMVQHGFLDQAKVTSALKDAMQRRDWGNKLRAVGQKPRSSATSPGPAIMPPQTCRRAFADAHQHGRGPSADTTPWSEAKAFLPQGERRATETSPLDMASLHSERPDQHSGRARRCR